MIPEIMGSESGVQSKRQSQLDEMIGNRNLL